MTNKEDNNNNYEDDIVQEAINKRLSHENAEMQTGYWIFWKKKYFCTNSLTYMGFLHHLH